jgi:hypothetical protein
VTQVCIFKVHILEQFSFVLRNVLLDIMGILLLVIVLVANQIVIIALQAQTVLNVMLAMS